MNRSLLGWLASGVLFAALAGGSQVRAQTEWGISSPDGRLQGVILADRAGVLHWQVGFNGHPVITASRLGLVLDGRDLGRDAVLRSIERGAIARSYPYTGGKSIAVERANTALFAFASGATLWQLEVRAEDDGFAFRYLVEGDGPRRVNGETTEFGVPSATRVWFGERNNPWKLKSYAGEWISADIDRMPTVSSQGPVQTAPLTLALPSGGYALISESAVFNYSGMRLRAVGRRRFAADFTEGTAGFVPGGRIVSPWRAVLCARDLDELVNDTLIDNLAPAPDPTLFADPSFIRPGRAVWRWQLRKVGQVADQMAYVDFARELNCAYSLVDEGWERDWPVPLAGLRDLCDYGKGRGIGILVWKTWKEVGDPSGDYAALRTWLDGVRAAGVVGVKVDFFNSEDLITRRGEERVLMETAKRRLMADLHGCPKPTGEAIRYPNEISREGIRGLELNYMKEGPLTPSHDAALPFTRCVVGRADYTPLALRADHLGATTVAHQLATVVDIGSPLLVFNAFPEEMLAAPPEVTALLRSVPTTWDETRVLPGSSIGGLAMLARRRGRQWIVGGLNGGPARTQAVPLNFLNGAAGAAVLISDGNAATDFQVRHFPRLDSTARLEIPLATGGGFVLRIASGQLSTSSGFER